MPLSIDSHAWYQTMPVGYELRAALTVEKAGAHEKRLLALRTGEQEFDLAMLSPHGLPVYSVSANKAGREIDRQVSLDSVLTPDEILTYLVMVYGDESYLRAAVTAREWSISMQSDRRLFEYKGGSAQVIDVRYRGNGPWYERIEISDSGEDIRIVLSILESARVASE